MWACHHQRCVLLRGIINDCQRASILFNLTCLCMVCFFASLPACLVLFICAKIQTKGSLFLKASLNQGENIFFPNRNPQKWLSIVFTFTLYSNNGISGSILLLSLLWYYAKPHSPLTIAVIYKGRNIKLSTDSNAPIRYAEMI